MAVTKFPKSVMAQRIARQWLRAAKAPRMAAPTITVCFRNHTGTSGHCSGRHRIHLGLGKYVKDRRDWLILLAHELAHAVCAHERHQGEQVDWGHGPRFHWWFWRLLPRKYWEMSVEKRWRWDTGGPIHNPHYQPEENV